MPALRVDDRDELGSTLDRSWSSGRRWLDLERSLVPRAVASV